MWKRTEQIYLQDKVDNHRGVRTDPSRAPDAKHIPPRASGK